TAKGLSSGYAPLGAVIVSPKVVEVVAYGSGAFLQGFTYSSHPITLAAGRAVLNYMTRNGLVQAADSDHLGSIASVLKAGLKDLKSDVIGDVRGLGLMWAVEFVADRESK